MAKTDDGASSPLYWGAEIGVAEINKKGGGQGK